MRYRIEYANGHSSFVADRQELLSQIKMAEAGTVMDIRKQYKSGVSDSVMEKYVSYLNKDALARAVTLTGAATR